MLCFYYIFKVKEELPTTCWECNALAMLNQMFGRTPTKCYLSSRWKRFVNDSLLVVGDSIKLEVNKEYGKIIHVNKV